MLNQTVLVGRMNGIESKNLPNGKMVATLTLAVPRSFKNSDGTYDTDFIECVLFDNVAQNTQEYCHKGDILGIKGRIQSRVTEKKTVIEIIAEKVTFLTSSTKNGA